jgi:hypothetical protein
MIELKNVERSYKTRPTRTWVLQRIARYGRQILELRDGWMTSDEEFYSTATQGVAQ